MITQLPIVPFRPELASAFTELNRAWIEALFTLEEADWKVLRDPEAAIITPGGQIFFAMDGEQAVGTAAAIWAGPGIVELGKMAVTPSHRGRGLGERLGHAVIDYARAQGATRVFLETNSTLANAIRLYERLGFTHTPFPGRSDSARADVYMEL
jgi:GNAT superfamily N-acetyltransferase